MNNCESCQWRRHHCGHGECSNPANGRALYENILWGCNEQPKPTPAWCPIGVTRHSTMSLKETYPLRPPSRELAIRRFITSVVNALSRGATILPTERMFEYTLDSATKGVSHVILSLHFAQPVDLVLEPVEMATGQFSAVTRELLMRNDFERRCLEHFNAKRAAGVSIIDDNGAPATHEALFWKNEDGSYGVAAFNVAWIAYRWGIEAADGGKV